VELATIAFGYGITATPLQITAGIAAIGNGGVYNAPRIVESVTDADGTVKYVGTGPSRQMVKEKTARQMRAMLESVFERGPEGGTGKGIVVPGFRCAGKTGTAHKYDPETHRYAEHRYLGSFAGLAPADHPRLAIVVMIDEPSVGSYFGGDVAGPVFARVASESLRYLGVPGKTLQCPTMPPGWNPRLDPTPKTCTIPAPKPIKGTPTVKLGGEDLVIEDPLDVAPPPAPDPGDMMIPDFRGMGYAKALETARAQHMAISVRGSGRVVEQSPAPGPSDPVESITLRFANE